MRIMTEPFKLSLYGFSGIAMNKDYSGMAFNLMNKMWKAVKENNLKNNGLNVWVYEPNEIVFAGVELIETPHSETGLELKRIELTRYVYYKHIGPYSLIQQAGLAMRRKLSDQNLEASSPYIEIYGHWTNDESKLETELIMALK